jgi:hypothetical protein
MVINFDPYGSLYVASTGGSEVRKCSIGSMTPVIIVDSLGATPSLGETAAIAFDSDFNLDVADMIENIVVKFPRL